MFRTSVFAAVLALGVGRLTAQPLSPTNYTISPQVGPYVICVASYRGEDARATAEDLCRDLRTGYKVAAYTFNRADEERRKENERVATLRAQHKQRLRESGLPEDTPIHIKTIRIEDQYAVLVGGWKDDVATRKFLDDVRKIKPPEKLQFFVEIPGPGA